MVNFVGITIILGLVTIAAVCNATPVKLNKVRITNNRFLARQEAVDENLAQTPYPPAGNRPEIPFDLPNESKLLAPPNHYLPPLTDPAMFYSAPAEVYGPPAKTYGPPDANEESVTELPEEETQTEPIQEEATTQGIDLEQELEDKKLESIDNKTEKDFTDNEEGNIIPERLVLSKSTDSIKAAKFKALSPNSPKTNKAQEFYLINGMLYTVA